MGSEMCIRDRLYPGILRCELHRSARRDTGRLHECRCPRTAVKLAPTIFGRIFVGLALALAIPAFGFGGASHASGDWLHFAAVAAGLGVTASIIGNALWNRMSRLLPLTMVGQMILFETLFALLYGFLWEERGPTLVEVVAICSVVLSVVLCMRAHRPKKVVA